MDIYVHMYWMNTACWFLCLLNVHSADLRDLFPTTSKYV